MEKRGENVMGKKVLIAMAVLFCISSVGLGFAGYQAALKIAADSSALERFDWVVPLTAEYRSIGETDMDGGYLTAETKNGDFVLLDREGNPMDETKSGEWLWGQEDFYSFEKGDQMGLRRLDGSIMIPAKYDDITSFDGDYALANLGEDYFAIDRKGEIVYEFEGGEEAFARQVDGQFFCQNQGERGQWFLLIDVKKGEVVKKWDSSDCNDIWKCGPRLYGADGICGKYFLDEKFEPAFGGMLLENNGVGDYGEGLIPVRWVVNGTWKDCPPEDEKQVKTGYIEDLQGNMVFETPGSVYRGKFSDGKALVYEENRVYCVDRDGNQIFELPLKKKIELDMWKQMDQTLTLALWILPECCFSGGMARVFDGEKMGLVDEGGNWLIKPVFDEMNMLGSGFIAVEYRGKWGVIDGRRLAAEAAAKGEL